MMMDQIIRQGTITPAQLQTLLMQDDGLVSSSLKILDSTFVLPGSPENLRENYNNRRLPGALFFDIDGIADKAAPLPHTAPTRHIFEAGMSALGITPDDLVVLYGQHGMTMGPCRVWWTLRLFGHDRVCVLDGGLPAWIRFGGTVENSPPKPPAPSHYKARAIREELLISRDRVTQAMESGMHPILDARPRARFDGTAPEPRPGMRSGHIPGSLNIPASDLVDPERGTLKPDSELKRILEDAGFDFTTPNAPKAIATCGSGITACVIALALYRQGFDKIGVYDGSWAEWGQESAGNKISCAP
ncbi:MAG: sulfurtransferase [Alphaproteobacteria bacterium]|nr:sulfurtransferase [Alphaproteobacteria bacterium]